MLASPVWVDIEEVAERVEGVGNRRTVMKDPAQRLALDASDLLGRAGCETGPTHGIVDRLLDDGDPQALRSLREDPCRLLVSHPRCPAVRPSEDPVGRADDLLSCDPSGQPIARVEAVGMFAGDVVVRLGDRADGADFERFPGPGPFLGPADRVTIDEEIAVAGTDDRAGHTDQTLDEEAALRIGPVGQPAEGHQVAAVRQGTLLNQEERTGKACGEIEGNQIRAAEGEVRGDDPEDQR